MHVTNICRCYKLGWGALRSSTIADAPPPPLQMAATPMRALLASSTDSSRMTSAAPLAPMGCPSATAPPCTFTLHAPCSKSQSHLCVYGAWLCMCRCQRAQLLATEGHQAS